MSNNTIKETKDSKTSRREFIKSSAALGGLTMLTGSFTFPEYQSSTILNEEVLSGKSIIGGYGDWADGLRSKIPELSFRTNKNSNLKKWKKKTSTQIIIDYLSVFLAKWEFQEKK